MVKSLTASLVSREEEERHQRNLNEDEQLKNQIAEVRVEKVGFWKIYFRQVSTSGLLDNL